MDGRSTSASEPEAHCHRLRRDEWCVRAPGAARSIAALADCDWFVAPAGRDAAVDAVVGRRGERQCLSLSWTVLAPSVFGDSATKRDYRHCRLAWGARRCSLVRGGLAAEGMLVCHRALVLECRDPVAQADVLAFAAGAWRSPPPPTGPARAARRVFDDGY